MLISQDSVEGAKKYIDNQITKIQVLDSLGISEKMLDTLVSAEILHIFHKFDNISLNPYFSRIEVFEFVSKLSANQYKSDQREGVIDGFSIIYYSRFSDSDFLKFIIDVLSGELPTIRRVFYCTGVVGLTFNLEDFGKWERKNQFPKIM
ncbi:hypothetical protein ACO0K2_19560 [Undibacterium sp. MH2W]|uniref:hypothetical protein n=1 Tax=Undibacterium sp. MH2W TaxID=3413044 RepID=UPI003BF378AE